MSGGDDIIFFIDIGRYWDYTVSVIIRFWELVGYWENKFLLLEFISEAQKEHSELAALN